MARGESPKERSRPIDASNCLRFHLPVGVVSRLSRANDIPRIDTLTPRSPRFWTPRRASLDVLVSAFGGRRGMRIWDRRAAGRPSWSTRMRGDLMRSRDGADKALEFLATLAREFTAVLSLDYLMTRVLELLREVAGFDSCIVGLIDERDPDLLTIG